MGKTFYLNIIDPETNEIIKVTDLQYLPGDAYFYTQKTTLKDMIKKMKLCDNLDELGVYCKVIVDLNEYMYLDENTIIEFGHN